MISVHSSLQVDIKQDDIGSEQSYLRRTAQRNEEVFYETGCRMLYNIVESEVMQYVYGK